MSRVTLQDIRAIKFCNRGTRAFFDRHGLNWSSFVQDGIEFEKLEALNDGMANQAIEQARKRLSKEVQ